MEFNLQNNDFFVFVPYSAPGIGNGSFSELLVHSGVEVVAEEEAPEAEERVHLRRNSRALAVALSQAVLRVFEVGLLNKAWRFELSFVSVTWCCWVIN